MVSVENNTKLHLCMFGHGTKTNDVIPCILQTQHKVTQPLFIFIRNGVLVFCRCKRFPAWLVLRFLRRARYGGSSRLKRVKNHGPSSWSSAPTLIIMAASLGSIWQEAACCGQSFAVATDWLVEAGSHPPARVKNASCQSAQSCVEFRKSILKKNTMWLIEHAYTRH